MPNSLPPLPDEMQDSPNAAPAGSPNQATASAFAGGAPPEMQMVQEIEERLQKLAMLLPSSTPAIAQIISIMRTSLPQAMAAGAGPVPSGGPTGPAITGMGQNPTALPSPPQPGM